MRILVEQRMKLKNIIVTAQHLDGIDCGRGMGAVLPASLSTPGARATF